MGEWLDTWLKTYALYSVKSYTYDAYERSCNIHIKPALGRIRLSALTAPQIQQFYNSLITEKELSPKTVKNIHGVLHRALGQAVKLGMLRSNPTNVCDLPKAHRKEIKPMEQAEITKISASDPRDEVWAGVSNHPVHRIAGGRSAGTDMGLY